LDEVHPTSSICLLLFLLHQGLDACSPIQRLARRLLVYLLGYSHGYHSMPRPVSQSHS
jgi:hypothetical protein